MENPKFVILSPDGFLFDFNEYEEHELDAAFEKIKERYAHQGYYSTSNREHIMLDNLRDNCSVMPADYVGRKLC